MKIRGKQKARIALYGIGGVYNYGCEAIVRGTINVITKKYPEAEVTYISNRFETDKKALDNSNIGIESLFGNPIKKFVYRGFHKIERGIYGDSISRKSLLSDKIKYAWIKKYDIILSIGGDIYTLPSEMEIKENEIPEIIKFGRIVKQKRKKLIIWGASIGPFTSHPKIETLFFKHFINDVNWITAREEMTIKYLNEKGYHKCSLFSDPAYSLKSPNDRKENNMGRLTIGINLSPLSLKYANIDDFSLIIDKQVEAISNLSKKYNARIMLIPHVIAPYECDDDYRYMKKIQDKLDKNKVDSILLEPYLGFMGTKKYLSQCKLVIASRMHCAVNAISCLVPTIFLAYSRKSYGMCKYVYGSEEYVLNIFDFQSKEKLDIIMRVLNDHNEIVSYLEKRYRLIYKSAFEAAEVLERVYEDDGK